MLFGKFPNTLIAHGDPITLPKVAKKVDYEAELVVVDRQARQAHPERQERVRLRRRLHRAATTCRPATGSSAARRSSGSIGKTFDTFAPTGPVLVTADEMPDPHKLQDPTAAQRHRRCRTPTPRSSSSACRICSWYLSQVVTLEPGDLIFTGTPPGVGIARKPPVLLKAGDVVEVEIEKIGVLKNACVGES